MPYIKATEELFKDSHSGSRREITREALEGVIAKEVLVDGFPFKVQFNPARISFILLQRLIQNHTGAQMFSLCSKQTTGTEGC